jgi:hypothetical protein
MAHTGEPADTTVQRTRSSGNGLMRSLEVAAKKAGVEILLEHRMTRIYRQAQNSGPVLGIAVDNKGIRLSIRARRPSLSAPAARPAISTSDACSTLA